LCQAVYRRKRRKKMNGHGLRAGYRTTEFATVLASLLVTVLVLAGVMNAEEEQAMHGALVEIVLALGSLLSNAAVVVAYIRSRTALKQGEG
jgi:hypothetical protein